jgi:ABC-2 type transport system permease protein
MTPRAVARTLSRDPGLYAQLVSAAVRSQMQYKLSFAIQVVTNFLAVFVDFVTLYILVGRFGSLAGWALLELGVLYGIVHCAWALVDLTCAGFSRFAEILLRGELDRWLLRPRSVLLQIAAHEVEMKRLGRLLQGAAVLAVSCSALGLGPASWAWIVAGIAGGVAFFLGIVLIGAAAQLVTLGQTSELQNVLTYGGCNAMSYPVSIYSRWFRRVVTYGIPLAFVSYFPALMALDRAATAGYPSVLPWLSPIVCGAVLLIGHATFSRALSRYESTGS